MGSVWGVKIFNMDEFRCEIQGAGEERGVVVNYLLYLAQKVKYNDEKGMTNTITVAGSGRQY